MADQLLDSDGDGKVDLVAFVIEGFGTFLVPLDVLAPYAVDANPLDDDEAKHASFGWGWQLPTVQWNTFHVTQKDRTIALGDGVFARLDGSLFPGSAGSEVPPS